MILIDSSDVSISGTALAGLCSLGAQPFQTGAEYALGDYFSSKELLIGSSLICMYTSLLIFEEVLYHGIVIGEHLRGVFLYLSCLKRNANILLGNKENLIGLPMLFCSICRYVVN